MNRLPFISFQVLCLIVGASSDSFYFAAHPFDQDVEEGQPVRLECAVNPAKDIYYSWLHNGSHIEIEKENGRRYLEMDSNLQILHADRELDKGVYQCEALNRSSTFTSASREAVVNIYYIEPDVHIRLVRPDRYEAIKLGKEVELACDAHANPPLSAANIKWYHNGNGRLPNTELRGNGNLRIAVIGVEHTGSYHCRVVHAGGKLDSRPPYVIQIDDTSSSQVITSYKHEDFSKFVLRGRSLELTCPQPGILHTSDGMPPITVWGYMQRLGEQQQSVSKLSNVQLIDTDAKLVITTFDVQHVNYYTCETSLPGTPDKYVFLFQVEMATLYNPKRSDFSPRLKKNQFYVVRINEKAELRYYSDQSPLNSFLIDEMSNPSPKIEWFKKGERQPIPVWFPPDDSELTHSRKPRRYALRRRHLIIHQVTEEDSGTYEMMLTNVAGRTSIMFDLLVTFPPEFHQRLLAYSEHSYDEDTPITLDCGIQRRANRGSTVYWEKDQRMLKQYSSNLVVLESENERLRFTQLKPEDQGKYQCFVKTEGYDKRVAGAEQKLIVKAKLQFLRELQEQFLEVNVQGRIPCKARGHGTITIDWFRKVGPHPEDIEPIRPPNQVESGTLILQYVQKQDAGEYVCVAQSTYKNSRISMTVKVVVGEKPHIFQISPNQTVRVGSQLILNCHASGDPPPQIRWFVKRSASKMTYVAEHATRAKLVRSAESVNRNAVPIGGHFSLNDPSNMFPTKMESHSEFLERTDISGHNPLAPYTHIRSSSASRVHAYPNGSLVIQNTYILDRGEYICVASNKHAIQTPRSLFVHVMSPEEYTRRQLGEGNSGSGMVKTILIVVGCAVTYLGLIIGLTVFCSMRMLRTRQKRSRKGLKVHENGQLLNNANDLNGNPPSASQTNAMESGLVLTGMGSTGTNPCGNVSFAHLPQHSHPLLSNASNVARSGGLSCYQEGQSDSLLPNAIRQASLGAPSGLSSMTAQLPAIPVNDKPTYWWPGTNHGCFNHTDISNEQPQHHLMDVFMNSNPDTIMDNGNHGYMHPQAISSSPHSYGLMYNGLNGPSPGVGSSTIATTASESQLVSAPPPTPLDSRSHFSGLSSGNSTSLYSRSVLSGASNLGSIPANWTHLDYGQPINGPATHLLAQKDRMNYPRCELKMEGMLGKGEFGDVFLARARCIRDDEVQSLVLVKSLTSHEPLHINEYHRQLELFGKLHHPNVMHLLGICMEQEPFYMLLEYCEWGDLKMFLRRMREENTHSYKMPPLTCEQKLTMCKQLARGMDYLAQLHCVHRDLAARNILLSQDMELKISSLGLAREGYAAEYYKLPNATEHYIPLRWFAPELIAEATGCDLTKQPDQQDSMKHTYNSPILPYSTSSDVWSFGILICEIFTLATLPLSRLSDQEIILAGQKTAIQHSEQAANAKFGGGTHVPLRPDTPADLPSDLADMLVQCWAPGPTDRPEFSQILSVLCDLTQ